MATSQELGPRGFFKIEEDLGETWIEDWADAGIAEIEEYLGKLAALEAALEAPVSEE